MPKKTSINATSVTLLLGKKYNKLTIIAEGELYIQPSGHEVRRMMCQCDCGKVVEVSLYRLLSGKTKSCGCLRGKAKKHGFSTHPIHVKWYGAKDRCYNPKNIFHKDYGGRGITMCDEWLNDFMSFYNWSIENSYKKGKILDRIDNDKGYEPDNCRYVDIGLSNRNTRLLQANNKSGYRGVFWSKGLNKWIAYIRANSKLKFLGSYESKIQAALQYDAAAQVLNDGRPVNFI